MNKAPGPSRLSITERAALRAGMLRAERGHWMNRARAARAARGDYGDKAHPDVAGRYVRMARAANRAYLLQLSDVRP